VSNFTRISDRLQIWKPWTEMDYPDRCLWLGLYTTSPSIPGLWRGSVIEMAAKARMRSVDDALRSLDALLAKGVVEYDQHVEVLRLTALPDSGEWPMNASILQSWWKKFLQTPACGVRNAHVETIRWLIEQGSAEAPKNLSGKVSAAHEEVWKETFATIPIPAPRRRGMRRIADSDTGTVVQPSLFETSSRLSESDSVPVDHRPLSATQRVPSTVTSSSVGFSDNNEINNSNTVTPTVGRGRGGGGGGESSLSSLIPEQDPTPATPEVPAEHELTSAEAQILVIVTFSPADMLRELESRAGTRIRIAPAGTIERDKLLGALKRTIWQLHQLGFNLPDIAELGDALAAGGLPGVTISSAWLADETNIVRALTAIREQRVAARARNEMLQLSLQKLGIGPPPPDSGARNECASDDSTAVSHEARDGLEV